MVKVAERILQKSFFVAESGRPQRAQEGPWGKKKETQSILSRERSVYGNANKKSSLQGSGV
jgi:hypothetical protein